MSDCNLDIQQVHKEIDLIQACITRMASNSFYIRGWLVGLLAVIIGLFADNINTFMLCILILGVSLILWYLDAFYIKLETLYRWKYEWVISERLENNVEHLYDLDPYCEKMWLPDETGKARKDKNVIRYMFTKTLGALYALPCIVSIVVLIIKL